jgi:hypothetical protein
MVNLACAPVTVFLAAQFSKAFWKLTCDVCEILMLKD